MSQNKLIAKNTILLYLRMICSVCVSLYTSRIILQTLGVEDFGVYNIIGGVVALLGFLNTSMAGCTSRFFAYELGCNNTEKLKIIFNTSFVIHLCIALLVFLLGETLGLWFVKSQLVIPESRVLAANIVYQFSLLTAIISILQVPFSAVTIARERMDAFAIIELLNMLLRLCVVLLLTYLCVDKLIAYSILLLIVALVILVIYNFFCKRNFKESNVRLTVALDKEILLPMMQFAGWDIYGSSCVLIQQHGLNVIINSFFGVLLNAATGVATQASSAVSMFVSNFTMALRPPLIKLYAVKDWHGMERLLVTSLVLSSFLTEIVCVPLYLRIDDIMKLWLGDVPVYAISFCKWMLLANSISVINNIFVALIHATGNIKRLSIVTGTIYLSTVVFSYIAFRFACSPEVAYLILFVIAIIVLINNILIATRQLPKLSYLLVFKALLLPFLLLCISVILSILLNGMLPYNMLSVIILFIFNTGVTFLLLYVFWIGPRLGWNILKFIKSNEV